MDSNLDEKQSLIKIRELNKNYGSKNVLSNINLEIFFGDRIALIGANGSGKSTLVEIIAGIRKATSGSVSRENQLVIGIQFQDSKYPVGISVLDMIHYYLETFNIKYDNQKLDELLKIYQLIDIKKKQINTLSGGQQQRLNILLAVIHQPTLVILDEVSTGLDIEVREDIFEFLEENIIKKKITMILVTHMMSEVEKFCEKIVFLHQGVIKEQVSVVDAIKEYGSVHDYTRSRFKYYREQDKLQTITLQIEPEMLNNAGIS